MTANGRGSCRPVFSKENHSKPAAVIRQLDQKIAVGFGGKLLTVCLKTIQISGLYKLTTQCKWENYVLRSIQYQTFLLYNGCSDFG